MRSPLHLALVRASYSAFGGAERIVNRIVNALAARGVRVTVLARSWSSEAIEALPASVHWRKLDPFYLGTVWRQASFAQAVAREVAGGDFDLVQSHERIPGVALYRAGDGVHREWLAQRARVQSRWSARISAASPQHRWQCRAESGVFGSPRLRAVVCNSTMVMGEITRWFGVASDRLVLIRNGVDLQAFAPPSAAQRAAARAQLDVDGERPCFVYVGGGFERKGLAAAIRALQSVPDALLIVVGRDRRAADYVRLAYALGLRERVRFVGSQRDVRPYLHAANAFVLPSLYDPQPNAALEAMACGLAVITSTSCGAAELLADGGGAVSDALDVDAIAAAMRRYADRAAAQGAGSAARAAIEPYSLDRMAAEYMALYGRLLGVALDTQPNPSPAANDA